MKLLLDTHVFIWLNTDTSKISRQAIGLCENPSNQLYFSIVSAWEIQIKQQLGKLQLQIPLQDMIQSQRLMNNLSILPIELSHIYALQSLQFYHNDPFDRLIVAQTFVEEMILVSADNQLSQYDIKVIW
jgi:PIN domain nuclease of toxin-antitoxin system